MSRKTWTIFVCAEGDWQLSAVDAAAPVLCPVPGSSNAPLAETVVILRQLMRDQGYTGQGIMLAVPSAWCLCATVQMDDLPRRNRRSLMLYRLEEKLPIPAEELVVDFVEPKASANSLLGVGARLEPLRPVIEALEAAGISISSICPTALLALQGCREVNGAEIVLCDSGDGAIDVQGLCDSRPENWHRVGADAEALTLELRWHTLQRQRPLRITCIGVTPALVEVATDIPGIESVSCAQTSALLSATSAANDALHGRTQPYLDLRRDALAPTDPLRQMRTSLNWAAAALIFLALCVAGAMLVQANRYQSLRTDLRQKQADIFHRTLPDQQLPVSVKSRLASEERKLRGVSGQASPLPEHLSALSTMRRVMDALPRNLRYRLLELRFTGDTFYLEGQARSYSDAEAIAAALRRIDYLQVDPPQSEQRADQSVAFTLLAQPRPAAGAPKRAPAAGRSGP
jgi:type II secretory pathway component PulL